MNPYWDLNFFSFITLFFQRCFQILVGKVPLQDLASDELQIFVLIFIGISSALVGAFLVLKKMTMLANSISHTSLLGIILSYLAMKFFFSHTSVSFNSTLFFIAALVTALLTTALTDLFKRVFKLHEEASIGLIFTFLFALGVIIVTLYTKNAHLGVEAIMGNIDAIHAQDVKFSLWIAVCNFLIIALFFNYYKIFVFDEVLARSLGCYPVLFQYLLMIQTAFTAISAFRAVGVFLFLIFLTAPILAARLLTNKLKTLIGYAVIINSVSVIVGVALSRHILTIYHVPLSTGAMTCVCVALSYPLVIVSIQIKKEMIKLSNKRYLKKRLLKTSSEEQKK